MTWALGLGFERFLFPGFPVCWTLYYLNGLVASYVISRVLFKKNRGMFHRGASEVISILGAAVYTCFETYNGFQPVLPSSEMVGPVVGTGMVTVMIMLYNLARGLTKTIGTRTQIIQV